MRHRTVALACALAGILVSGLPALAANKLNVLKPTDGQVFHNGDQILVQARPNPGVQLPTLQVKWEITCTSCGNPPTFASVFVQPDLTNPQPGYDVTNVLAPGSYCARVELWPEQTGWAWSDKNCFTWSDKANIGRVRVPSLQKYPYPKIPNPGPLKPGKQQQTGGGN